VPLGVHVPQVGNPCVRTKTNFFAFAEARKSATLTVKKSKIQSWDKFGHRLGSNYFQANKVFWQTIRSNHAKYLVLLDLSKIKMVPYSVMRRASLADGESISKNFQTQSLSHHWTDPRYMWWRKIPSLLPTP